MSLTNNLIFQSLESHEQSAAAALEQSSFGILSAETLAEASTFAAAGGATTLGASFAGFQNITASLKAPSSSSFLPPGINNRTNDDSAVFKMPAAARRSKKGLIAAESLSDASKIVNEVMGDYSFRSDAPRDPIQ